MEEGNGEQQYRRERSREKNKSLTQTLMQQKQKQKEEDEDDFDMFADEGFEKNKNEEKEKDNEHVISTDDSGYYIPIVGTILGEDKKYRIVQKLGKGVFGVVLKCESLEDKKEYAVKVLRKNDMTEKSGIRQYKILQKVKEKTQSKKILQVFDHFYEKGHFCFVCEVLGIDLRTYSHRKQPTLENIRMYAISMFMISQELRNAQIIHADIKLDNFMFKDIKLLENFQKVQTKILDGMAGPQINLIRSEEKSIINNLKLVDFGTAYSVQEHNINVQYQVARYYRAPQIILGTQVKKSQIYGIDVWAMGCSLFQLFTNQFLFPGNSNNEMLKLMMETKGKFSIKMINKSNHREKYFDTDYNFLFEYVDAVTKSMAVKKMQLAITKERELMNMLKKHADPKTDSKELHNFRDFLEKCLALNPKDRLTPQEAMQHPFLHYQIKLS